MPTYTLKLKDKISPRHAFQKIFDAAKYSNHPIPFRPNTLSELRSWYMQRGVDIVKLVEGCRDPKSRVPEFENLIGSTWTIVAGKGAHIDSDNEVVSEVEGPGLLVMSNCQGHFEAACAARDRAIDDNSIFAFYEALTQGFSSIEVLLNEAAGSWNKNGGQPQLIDDFQNKVSLETKLNEWVPLISGGNKIDKTGRNWSSFKNLKKQRDEEATHPSSPSRGVDFKELVNNINAFRYGIAFFLMELHIAFGKQVPAIIINAIYYPDVELCDVPE